jgi:hypothetical protein
MLCSSYLHQLSLRIPERLAHDKRQRLRCERLLEKERLRIERAQSGDAIFAVPGDEHHAQIGAEDEATRPVKSRAAKDARIATRIEKPTRAKS